ncbi:MAG: hypothetical protein FWG14_04115 [Peptococcaceae bacterium]|nr:hypothetical protein [Peptococcaceae bacterium]
MSKRKVISILIAMVLVLGLFPAAVFAAPPNVSNDTDNETNIVGDNNVVNNTTVNFQLVFAGNDASFRPKNLQFALWDLNRNCEVDVLTVGGKNGHHKFHKAKHGRYDIRLKNAPAGFLAAYDIHIVLGANGVYIITCTPKHYVGHNIHDKKPASQPIVVFNQVPLVPVAGF